MTPGATGKTASRSASSAGRVADRVLRGQDAARRARRQPAAQRVDVDAAVEGEQPAHPGQREPEPDLDRRERRLQRHQQRVPAAARGQPGVEQPDAGDPDLARPQLSTPE